MIPYIALMPASEPMIEEPADVAPAAPQRAAWPISALDVLMGTIGLSIAAMMVVGYRSMPPSASAPTRYAIVTRDDAFGCQHLSVLRRIGSLTAYDPDVERQAARNCAWFRKGERLTVNNKVIGAVRAQRPGDHAFYWFFTSHVRLEAAP